MALAHLWLGLHSALCYAEEIGARSAAEVEAIASECWSALLTLGRQQGRLVEEERPSRRFLRVLLTLVTQHQAVLLPRHEDGARPPAGGELVGWIDDEALYLLPEAVHMAVTRFCKETGELFPIRQERLRRDLEKERLSECDEGRHTKKVRIGSGTHRVLMLHRDAVEALLGETFPPVPTVPGAGR